MIYELRTYSVMPGRLPDLHKRFAEIALEYFKKHGIRIVAFWTNEIGGASDQLIYLLAFENLAEREEKCAAFVGDKDRLAQFAETEKNGPLVRRANIPGGPVSGGRPPARKDLLQHANSAFLRFLIEQFAS